MSRWQSHIDQILGDARARAAGQDSANKTASAPGVLDAAKEAADALDFVAHQDPGTGASLRQFFVEKAALAPAVSPTMTTGEQAEPPRKTGKPAASPSGGSRPAVTGAPAGQMPVMPISQEGGGLVAKKATAAGAGMSPPAQHGMGWSPIARGPQDDPQSWSPGQWTPANAKVASQAEGTTLFDIVMQGRTASKEAAAAGGDPSEAGSSGLGRSIKRVAKGTAAGAVLGGLGGAAHGALGSGTPQERAARALIHGLGGAAGGSVAGGQVGGFYDAVKKYTPAKGTSEPAPGHGRSEQVGLSGLKKDLLGTVGGTLGGSALGALAGGAAGHALGVGASPGAMMGGVLGAAGGGATGALARLGARYKEAPVAKKEAASQEDLDAAKNKARAAMVLHGLSHFGPGPLAGIPAGYVQRNALLRAGIDPKGGGEGTFGAQHPILSGLLPVAGTISAYNASERIGRTKPSRSSSEKKAMSPAQYVGGQDSGAAPSANEGSLTRFLSSNEAAVGYTKRDAKLPTRARIKEVFQNVDDPANGEAARAAFPTASARGGLKVASLRGFLGNPN